MDPDQLASQKRVDLDLQCIQSNIYSQVKHGKDFKIT